MDGTSFIAQIKAVVDTKDANSALQSFLTNGGKGHQLKLTIDTADLRAKLEKSFDGTSIGESIGKQIGAAIAKNIKSSIESSVSSVKVSGLTEATTKATARKGVSSKQEAIWGLYQNDVGRYTTWLAQMEAAARKFDNVAAPAMDHARDSLERFRTLLNGGIQNDVFVQSLQEMADAIQDLSHAPADRIEAFVSRIKELNKLHLTVQNSLGEMGATMSPKLTKYFEQLDTGALDATLSKMKASLASYGKLDTTSFQTASKAAQTYEMTLQKVRAAIDGMSGDTPISQEAMLKMFEELDIAAKEYQNTIKAVSAESPKVADPFKGIRDFETGKFTKQLEQMRAFMNDNANLPGADLTQMSTSLHEYEEALQRVTEAMGLIKANGGELTGIDVGSLVQDFNTLNTEFTTFSNTQASLKTSGLTEVKKAVDAIASGTYGKQFAEMGANIEKFGSDTGTSMELAKRYFQEAQEELKNLISLTSGVSEGDLNVTEAAASYERLTQKIEACNNALKETAATSLAPKLDKLTKDFNFDAISSSIQTMEAKLAEYGNQSSETLNKARNDLQEYRDILSQVQAYVSDPASSSLSQSQAVELFDRLKKAGQNAAASLKQVGAELTKALSPGVALQKQQEVLKYMSENSRAAKKYGEALKQLAIDYENCATVADKNQLDQRFITIQNSIMQEGLTGKTLFDQFGKAFKNVGQVIGAHRIIMMIPQAVRSMVNEVRNVDKELTTIRKITGASDKEISNMFEAATDSAKAYGLAISDVIKAQADWVRLGFSTKEARELADVTALFQQVGDNMTQESASSALITSMKGFGLNVEDAMHIVDAFNNVADHMPIATDEMAEALSRSASSMHAAGNTMEQTMALITAANSVVQNPEKVGTAFQMISMRIRSAKEGMEELGLDTEGMIESTSKLREKMLGVSGVDILLDDHTFKSTYQILDELSKKWESYTDIQQAAITELIAGKRQGNIMSALMQNFDIAREALGYGENADNVAMKELQNYQRGIEYHMGVMRATFQDFSNTALDSDVIIGFTDALTMLLNVATALVDVFGNLGGLISGITIGKGLTTFIKEFKSLQAVSGAIGLLQPMGKGLASGAYDVSKVIGNAGVMEAIAATGDLDKAIYALGQAGINATDQLDILKNAFPQFGEAAIAAKLNVDTLTQGIGSKGGLWASIKQFANMHPVLTGLTAFGVAVGAVTLAINLYHKHLEEVERKASEAMDKTLDKQGTIDDQIKQITDLRTKLDSGTLSESEAYDAKSKLYDIQSSLIESYGKLAGAIDLVNGNLDTQVEKIRTLTEEEARRSYNLGLETYQNYNRYLNTPLDIVVPVGSLDGISYTTRDALSRAAEAHGLTFDENGLSAKGTAEEIYSAVDEFLTDVNFLQQKRSDDLSDIVTNLSSFLNTNFEDIDVARDFVDRMDLMSMIGDLTKINGKGVYTWYTEYADAVEKFNEAVATGTDTDEAYESFSTLDTEIRGMIDDGTLAEYSDMFTKIGESANVAGYEALEGTKKVRGYVETASKTLASREVVDALTEYGKGGSVKLNKSPIFSSDNLFDVGWGKEDKDLKPGDIATVYARTYSNEAGTIAMNFTPVIVDGRGNVVDVLSPDALKKYAEEYIEQYAHGVEPKDEMGIKIGATFEGADAIKQAEEAVDTIHELQETEFLDEDFVKAALGDSPAVSIANAAKELVESGITETQIKEWFLPNNLIPEVQVKARDAFMSATQVAKNAGMLDFEGDLPTTYEDVESLVDIFTYYGYVAQDATAQVNTAGEAIVDYSSEITAAAKSNDDFSKSLDSVDAIFTALEKGEDVDLSAFDDEKLLDFAGALEEVDGKLVLSEDKLIDVTGEQIADKIASNNELISGLTKERRKNLDEIADIEKVQKTYEANLPEGKELTDIPAWVDNQKRIQGLEDENEEYTKQINVLRVWNQIFSEFMDKHSGLNKEMSSARAGSADTLADIKKINDIAKDVKTTKTLDFSVFNDDGLSEYISAFTIVGDEVKVDEERLRELTDAKIRDTIETNNNTKALLQNSIAQNDAKIARIDARIEAGTDTGRDITTRAKLVAQNEGWQSDIKEINFMNASLTQTGNATGENAEAAKTWDQALKDTSSTASDVISDITKINDIVKEVNKTGTLDPSVFSDEGLLAYADAFSIVNGKVKVNEDRIKDLTKAKKEDTKATIENARALINDQLTLNTEEAALIEGKYESGEKWSDKDTKRYREIWDNNKKLHAGLVVLDQWEHSLDQAATKQAEVIEAWDTNFEKATSSASGFVSNVDKINNVVEEVKKTGELDLSIFDDKDLLAYASAFTIVNGKAVVNEDLIKQITEAKKADTEATIANTRAILENQLAQTNAEIEANNELIEEERGTADAVDRQAKNDALETDRDNIIAAIALLDQYGFALDNTGKKRDQWAESIDNANKVIKNASSVNDLITAAIKGEDLDLSVFDSEEMLKYADAIEVVNGKFTVNQKKLREIARAEIDNERARGKSERKRLKDQITENKATMSGMEDKTSDEYLVLEKQNKELSQQINVSLAYDQVLLNTKRMFDETVMAASRAVIQTQSLIQNVSTIQGFVEAFKGGEQIDPTIFDDDSMLQYADAIDVVNGKVMLNERLINRMVDAQVEAQIAENNLRKNDLQKRYDAVSESIGKYTKQMEKARTESEQESFRQTIAYAENNKMDLSGQIAQIDLYNQQLEQTISTYRTWGEEFDKVALKSDELISNLSAVNTVLAGFSTGKSIDTSFFSSDEMMEYAEAIEYVNGTLQLNTEKVEEITQAKVQEQIAVNETAKAYGKLQYKDNLRTISELTDKLNEMERAGEKGTEKYRDTLAQINSFELANEGILNRINVIDLYTQHLVESTSAYQRWLEAQNAGTPGDMGDHVVEAFKDIDRVLTKDDKELRYYEATGNTEYKAAIDFLVPDSVSAEGQEAIKSYVENLKTYFTNSAEGVDKFVSEAIDKGLVEYDPDTDSIRIAANKTMEDFANAFNWTPDAMQAMFGLISEYEWMDVSYVPYSRHEVFQSNRGGAELTTNGEGAESGYTTITSEDGLETTLYIKPTLPNGEDYSEKALQSYLTSDRNKEDITVRTFFGEDSEKQAKDYSDAMEAVQGSYDNTMEATEGAYAILKDYDAETLRNINYTGECTAETENARDAVLSLMETYGVAAENVQTFIDVMEDLGLIIGDRNQYNAQLQYEVETVIKDSDMSLEEIVALANGEGGDEFISKTFSIDVENTEEIEQVRQIINGLNSEEIEPITIKIDESSLEAINVMLHPEASEVEEYEAPPKEGEVTYTEEHSEVDAYHPDPKTGMVSYVINPLSIASINAIEKNTTIEKTINYRINTVGTPPTSSEVTAGIRPSRVNGTAHSRGTAYIGGKWGVDRNQVALTGELGREIVILLTSHATWRHV